MDNSELRTVLAKEGKEGRPTPFIAQIFFDVGSKTTRML